MAVTFAPFLASSSIEKRFPGHEPALAYGLLVGGGFAYGLVIMLIRWRFPTVQRW